MAKYIVQRILEAIPLLFLVTIATYFIMNLAPGGPLSVYLHNPHVSQSQIAILAHQLGLNQPWYVRYFKWLWALLHGNWGYSYFTGQPVISVIAQRLPNTLILMGAAFIVSLGIGLPLGIYSATHRYTAFDYTFSFLSFFAWAMPSFFFGLLLQIIFAVKLGILPVAGMYSEFYAPSFLELLRHLILPTAVLGLGSLAGWSRFMRSGMLEVIQQDYIRTARAKGLKERTVIMKHALKNALLPIVTIIGMDLPAFFGGAVITEQIFAWPGMGRLFLTSLNNRDYPLQMAELLISAALLIVGNLLADLVYGLLDPRIQYN
ncbi:MAG: ABC transporter permease [Firmicutes bacterium]|nr:ABC transporter permease [Bacillota bacterium]